MARVVLRIYSTKGCVPCQLMYCAVAQRAKFDIDYVMDDEKMFDEYPTWQIIIDGEAVYQMTGYHEKYVDKMVEAINLAIEKNRVDKLKTVFIVANRFKFFVNPATLISVIDADFRCPCRPGQDVPCPCGDVSAMIKGELEHCTCRLYYVNRRKMFEDFNALMGIKTRRRRRKR